ncbi:MAG: hypothetical protein ACFCUV_07070 [Rivularia sp. (in: cyanobacteria)]
MNNFVHRVRFYYEDGGKNSKIALDDITSILLYSQPERLKSSTEKESCLPPVSDSEILAKTKEKMELAEISPLVIKDLHFVGVDKMEDFYYYCDDLATEEVYECLSEWLQGIAEYVMLKNLLHLGNLASQLPTWAKYQQEVRVSGIDTTTESTLKQWLQAYIGISIDWLLTVMVHLHRNKMSVAHQIATREKASKEEGSKSYNINEYALIIKDLDNILIGRDRHEFFLSLSKKSYIEERIEDDLKQAKSLSQQGFSDEEIALDLWEITEKSKGEAPVNYQREFILYFLQTVRTGGYNLAAARV